MRQTASDAMQQRHTYRAWRSRVALLLLGLCLAYAIRLGASWLSPPSMPPTVYDDLGGDFTLQAAHGPVSLDAYRGSIVLLFFGYTGCPDVCPVTLANIAAALRLLKGMAELEKVQAVFITLDPERDSAEKVDTYARYFHPRIHGLTGTSAQVAQAAAAFKIAYSKHPAESGPGYAIDHSAYIYVLRPDGRVGAVLSHTATPKDIVEAVKPWLAWARAS